MAAGYRRASRDLLPHQLPIIKHEKSDEETPLLLDEEEFEKEIKEKLTFREIAKKDAHTMWIMIISSYINILLVFVPIGAISYYDGWNGTAIFFLNFLAMIPVSSLLGDATECLADYLGEIIGGFVNATFSNTVEVAIMVIGLVKSKTATPALKYTLLDVVQTSLMGSVFSNSLLVLGCCLLANGIYYKTSSFNLIASSTNISLLFIAAFVLLLPSAYTKHNDQADILFVSRATAIVLILMYCCLLFFMLYTHKDEVSQDSSTSTSINTSINDIEEKIGDDGDGDGDEIELSLMGSFVALGITSFIITMESEYLVAGIKPMTDDIGLEPAFVGIILIPIVGNAVEHVTAVRMALKNKMDIALSITIGSATQIAMFVVALAVIVAWGIGVELTLAYDPFEVQVFLYATIVVFVIIYNGTSNWLQGAMLLALYILIAIAVYHQQYCRGDEINECEEYKSKRIR